MTDLKYYDDISRQVRLRILELTYASGKNGAHIGSGLSSVDLLVALYYAIMKYDVTEPFKRNRDRFILSKGHSALAHFAVLEQTGFISKDELDRFENNGSPFFAHATRNLSKGIEFSGGSLSLGISFGVGVALACKKDGLSNNIYVMAGDGECDEGLVWEALMSAAHFKLTNLTIIVDFNGLQSDGCCAEVMDKSLLPEKFKSFGFHVQESAGHDFGQIIRTFNTRKHNKPNAIIAHTVKGKGISFMENNVIWHHNSLSDDQYKQALCELTK